MVSCTTKARTPQDTNVLESFSTGLYSPLHLPYISCVCYAHRLQRVSSPFFLAAHINICSMFFSCDIPIRSKMSARWCPAYTAGTSMTAHRAAERFSTINAVITHLCLAHCARSHLGRDLGKISTFTSSMPVSRSLYVSTPRPLYREWYFPCCITCYCRQLDKSRSMLSMKMVLSGA